MDASKLIEALLAGAGGQQGQQPQGGQQAGGLGGLLGGLAGALGGQGQAPSSGQAASGGGLGGLLGGLAGALGGGQNQTGAQPSQQSQAPAGGGGLADMLGKLNSAGGGLGGLAAGGLIGMFAGRGGLGSLAKIGGVAALGYLAHNALKNWQAGQGQPAPAEAPDPRQQLAAPASDGNPFAFTLVRAMISAAAADGAIDEGEQRAITAQLEKLDLGADGDAIIQEALRNPASAGQIANLADGPEQGAQIYLMSRIAINPDLASERAYLNELAGSLGIPDDFIAHLEQQVRSVQA